MQTLDNSKCFKNLVPFYGSPAAFFCTLSSKKATIRSSSDNYLPIIYENSVNFTFTGKEKDEETGYGYFGARYILQLKSHWA